MSYLSYAVVAAIALFVGMLAHQYLQRIVELTPEEALREASAIAWKFWQIYSFKMPGLLADGRISPQELIEAGLVLKGLVVGESRDPALSSVLTSAHPELVKVDPMALAVEIRRRVQAYVGAQTTQPAIEPFAFKNGGGAA